MVWLRSSLRNLISALSAGLLVAIIGGVIGQFFIELAREKGWYDRPSERLDSAVNAFSAFITQSWVLVITAFLAGVTVGLWTDYLLRRRERLADELPHTALITDAVPLAEPMGMLDYLVDGLQAIKDIGKIFDDITKDTTRTNNIMSKYKLLLRFVTNLGIRRKLVAQLARKINLFSHKMHQYASRMREAGASVENNFIPFVETAVFATSADFEALAVFGATVTKMIANTSFAVYTMQNTQRIITENLTGISQDMNAAATLLLGAIGAFITETNAFSAVLERLNASCQRQITQAQGVSI